MCGLSCIINRKGKAINKNRLIQMTDIIKHRGPDGYGYHFDDSIGLGHRRLAIIDLSEDGHQPFIDNNLVLVFNGEIYNYLEIRTELQELGVTFRTKTDTEVLLKAYRHWGKDCLHRFNGMWAFIIYDTAKKTVFASRDRYGIKPLYYYIDDEEILLSSEIKQIHRVRKLKVNGKILNEFLQEGRINHTHYTFYEGVFTVRQGHNLIFDFKSNITTHDQYYDLERRTAAPLSLSYEEACEQFRTLFEDAVKLRLRSDVKVGMSLSGGLDSTSIAAVAVKSIPDITSFSAIYDEKGISEKVYHKAALDHLKLKNHVISPSYEDFKEYLARVVWYHDQPIATTSSVVDYLLYKKKVEEGVSVSLNGQGADEILAGYLGFYKARGKELLCAKSYLSLLKFVCKSFLNNGDIARQLVIATSSKKIIKGRVDSVVYSDSNVRELSIRYLTKSGFATMLHSADRSSMAWSVESRQPFLDWRLVEFCLKLPSSYKIDGVWTKKLLRDSMKMSVPDKILHRKRKLGYATPQEVWFAKNSSKIASEIETHKIHQALSSSFVDDIKSGKVESPIVTRVLSSMAWSDVYELEYSA